MIAKGASIAHGYNAIAYGLGKDSALEVCRGNLSGTDTQEIWQEMQIIANQNPHCRRNVLRFELSPVVDEGQKLAIEDWRGIAQDFIRKMELDQNHQWLAVLHTDRSHKHLHLYANRIDFGGKAYRDNYLSMKSGRIGREIAQERGLTLATDVKKQRDLAKQPIIEAIKRANQAVIRNGMTSKQYQAAMGRQGIEVVFNQSKTTGRISGISFLVNGIKVKASEVDRNMSYHKLFGIPREVKPTKSAAVRHVLGATRGALSPILPPPTLQSGSIDSDLAKMFGYAVTNNAPKPDEKEKEEEQNLTL